jgi:hypothetical protein
VTVGNRRWGLDADRVTHRILITAIDCIAVLVVFSALYSSLYLVVYGRLPAWR